MQDEIVAYLSDPRTYGIDVPVQRVETHASIVFLAGDRAYKLKKSVRYSYLDYSTPERRHAACEAEYRINRAIAAKLYLKVEPVSRDEAGGLSLGGAGQPIDWVLVMRRFAQADRLDKIAERGELTAARAIELADLVAAFHAKAEICAGFGGAQSIAAILRGIVDNLRLGEGTVFDAARLAAWISAASGQFERVAELIDRRSAAGRVRACHGDLHLGNICLVDGELTLFDAIEFDPALSSIDPLYDLAFLLMDLERRGLRPVANRILNRYLDRRAEADGLAALPLFLSLRAAIRAEVTAAAAGQHDGAEATSLAADAAGYLDLAQRLLDDPRPRLVALGGFSGTGKSTLAYALAPGLGPAPGARVLRSDMIRKRNAGIPPEARLPETAYGPEAHAETYREILQEARICLAAGYTAIVDAVHACPDERQAVASLAVSLGVDFAGLWLEAPAEIAAARVKARVSDASDATTEVLAAQIRRGAGPIEWPTVDAAGTPAEVLDAALAALAPTPAA